MVPSHGSDGPRILVGGTEQGPAVGAQALGVDPRQSVLVRAGHRRVGVVLRLGEHHQTVGGVDDPGVDRAPVVELADEGRGVADERPRGRAGEGRAHTVRGGTHPLHQGGEVERPTPSDLLHVGCPGEAPAGPGGQYGQHVPRGAPCAGSGSGAQGDVEDARAFARVEVVAPVVAQHERIGRIGPGQDLTRAGADRSVACGGSRVPVRAAPPAVRASPISPWVTTTTTITSVHRPAATRAGERSP